MSDLLPEVIPSDELGDEPEPEPETASIPVPDELSVTFKEEVELPAPSVKPIMPDEDVFNDVPVKPKKPRSEKQMAHLKRAREKALATRRAKIKARKDAEAESRASVQRTSPSPPPRRERRESVPEIPADSSMSYLSKADILELQQKAIEGYDNKRKARKADKIAKQEADRQASKTYESVAKAIHQPSNPDPDDVWAICFQ